MVKGTFHCTQCSYVSAKKFNLQRHVVTHHSSDRPKKLKPILHCDECEYTTKKSSNLKRHSLKHFSNFPSTTVTEKVDFHCYHCSYVTDNKSCLRSHMLRNHLKDRLNQPRITCSVCGLKIITRCQLREHLVESHDVTIEEEIRTFTNEDGKIFFSSNESTLLISVYLF
jgi:hypothetical protein